MREKWPDRPLMVAQSLDGGVDDLQVTVLPRLIPDPFYPPGDGADVFGLTRRLHLEERPRLVCFGDHKDGAALSIVLESVPPLLASGGELVFWDAAGLRDRLAPVIKHLRLTEHVVFAPPLEIAELAALFLGADAMILMENQPANASLALTWAMASGNPIVAVHSPENEAVLGPAALWVYDANPDVLQAAIQEVLSKESLREELAQRQAAITSAWRFSTACSLWEKALPA
ncbi:MAG: glycosyl transferase family 1 [Sulfobacillus acidophilus]|uniref:Glycosyl transferase family 1 n=1 Tax=Sulfobacillus acidophilus TaxID=53633 RepID=A0A2T2WEG1_9FIRM|nr:MAG: glycosyl transferase family 1 [Sulfobacillus acidophilus]